LSAAAHRSGNSRLGRRHERLGYVSLTATAALLAGSIPTIALTRWALVGRQIPDRVHAVAYLMLLGIILIDDGRDQDGLAGETRQDSLIDLLRRTRADRGCPWRGSGQGGERVRVGAGLARVVRAGLRGSRNANEGAEDDSSGGKQFRDHFWNFLPFS
jgi:hypothetical protein